MIRDLVWRVIARIVTIPAVTNWLIERGRRTPYTNITSSDGSDIYMVRLWVFNPYTRDANGDPAPARWPSLPSMRLHHIRRPDTDRHLHDHPWNARTIILRGHYTEERYAGEEPPHDGNQLVFGADLTYRHVFNRPTGYTGRLLFGEYHRIRAVPPEGVWTLFITWEKQGTWGFLVDGVKVPWRKYLGLERS